MTLEIETEEETRSYGGRRKRKKESGWM